jgi:hypothetical protein
MCKIKLFFGLLFLLFLLPVSELAAEYGTTKNTQDSETRSKPQTPENYSGNSTPQTTALNEQPQTLLNPDNPWRSLRELIDSGMKGLSESSEALSELERQLETLKAETQEQRRLLGESRKLVISLKRSLADAQNNVDIAIDRMKDAENYAAYIDTQNELLKKEAQNYKNSALINFGFGGVSLGVGVPLVIEGIRSDNRTMALSGAGVAVGTAAVWAVGHYVFHWW